MTGRILRLAYTAGCSTPIPALQKVNAFSMASGRPRIQLVLDFDGTITTSDTTAIIGARCLAKARELAHAELSKDKEPRTMEYYSQQYFEEYLAWKDSSTCDHSERKTVSEEIRYLSQTKHIEQASFSRVRDDILSTPGAIQTLAANESLRNLFMMQAGRDAVRTGEVQIRDVDGLKKLLAIAHQWAVLSMSWSRRFIVGALSEAGLIAEQEESDVAKRIHCNELLVPDCYNADGKLTTVSSAADKQQAYGEIPAEWDMIKPATQTAISENISIYVGDSTTDIGCLTDATIGMYVSDKPPEEDSVIEMLKRLDVQVVTIPELPISNFQTWLKDWSEARHKVQRPASLVCTVKSFGEIVAWLSKAVDTND